MAMNANIRYETPRALSARELVIDFISSRWPREMPARVIVDSALALGFSEQSVRMALTRLVEEGLAVTVERGIYKLAPSGDAMRREVRKWRSILDSTKSWTGGWVGIYEVPIRRSDRAALRRHEQALRLRGFRRLTAGLSIRPANLRDSTAELREQLRALGLHPNAIVALFSDLDEATRARAMKLWDTKALLDSYEQLMRAIDASMGRVDSLPLAAAAGETLVLGRDVLRHINLDPLLPEELMPERPLRKLVRTMTVYDVVARQIWRRFMSQFEPRP